MKRERPKLAVKEIRCGIGERGLRGIHSGYLVSDNNVLDSGMEVLMVEKKDIENRPGGDGGGELGQPTRRLQNGSESSSRRGHVTGRHRMGAAAPREPDVPSRCGVVTCIGRLVSGGPSREAFRCWVWRGGTMRWRRLPSFLWLQLAGTLIELNIHLHTYVPGWAGRARHWIVQLWIPSISKPDL